MNDFSRISIGIKTFLRDFKLFRAIDGIRRNLPGAQMIIADDGEHTEEKDGLYAELIREGHKVFILPFDSGFGVKSNRILDSLDREFLLVGSDDFDFAPPSVALGIQKMVDVFDRNWGLRVLSGRVANRGSYEFHLDDQGDVVRELPVHSWDVEYGQYVPCDLTVNYSLIRRQVFWRPAFVRKPSDLGWERTNIRFDDEVKIGGGEHGAFFLDLKRAGYKVGWVPGVEISEQTGEDSPRYRDFRNRARVVGRPCFDKRGIKRWVLGNGQVDYNKE